MHEHKSGKVIVDMYRYFIGTVRLSKEENRTCPIIPIILDHTKSIFGHWLFFTSYTLMKKLLFVCLFVFILFD